MPIHRLILLLIITALLASTGCFAPSARIDNPSRRDINSGYSLFHKLMKDETQVADLLIIKDARKDTEKLIHEISSRAKVVLETLDKFAKDDPQMNFAFDGLPAVEVLTRHAIAHSEEMTLLGSKGANLEMQLLLTQHEAMNYAAHLAYVMGQNDSDPARRDAMRKWSEDFKALHDRVVAILTIK